MPCSYLWVITAVAVIKEVKVMIDWDEIAEADCADELREAKLWLFQENIRLENERRELAASQEKFLKERVQFRKELDELNRRTVLERKRLKEESLFFEKKLSILQNGFRQLDMDRQAFEGQKKNLADRTKRLAMEEETGRISQSTVQRLFTGISNPLALRKRYRDLVKIFHPDNPFGDEELIQMINREYLRRREEL